MKQEKSRITDLHRVKTHYSTHESTFLMFNETEIFCLVK